VAVALAGAGCADLAVVNRTAARAGAVAALAGQVGRVGRVDEDADVAQADLVVNATPVGMTGTGAPDEGWLVPPSLLHRGQVVADLIYAPRPTAWLAAAADAGAKTVDGLGMLVHQAAAQLELWTGLPAPVDRMWEAASARL
jgi:shikimate dehydrogenase